MAVIKNIAVVVLMCFALGSCAARPQFPWFPMLKALPNAVCPNISCAGPGEECRIYSAAHIRTCKWGQYCAGYPPVCKAFSVVGERCDLDAHCGVGSPLECKNHTCEAIGIGSECRDSEDCPGALLCDTSTHVCVAGQFAAEGEACSDYSGPKCDFTADFQCVDGKCIKAHTKKMRDPCEDDVECPVEFQCIGNICVKIAMTQGAGQVCSTWMQCQAGLACTDSEMSSGRCVRPGTVSVGKPCTLDTECGTGGVCECNRSTGQSVCWKRVVSSQRLVDRSIEMFKCLERGGYGPGTMTKCTNDFADIAFETTPWMFDCSYPPVQKPQPGSTSAYAPPLLVARWLIAIAGSCHFF